MGWRDFVEKNINKDKELSDVNETILVEKERMKSNYYKYKEIKRKEKLLLAWNKMLKVIDGFSDEKLSNEELTLLYEEGKLTEERMETLYVYGYDLSFLDEEKSEGRTR